MKQSGSSFNVLLFVPSTKLCPNGVLCGEVVFDTVLNTKYYLIHDARTVGNDLPKNTIGVIGNVTKKFMYNPKLKDWLELKPLNIADMFPEVIRVISNQKVLSPKEYQIIFYDEKSFNKCELLMPNSDSEVFDDHFQLLLHNIRRKQLYDKHDRLQVICWTSFTKLMYLFLLVDFCISRYLFTLKCSVLAMHFHSFVKNAVWSLEAIKQNRGFGTLDCRNYIFGLIGDWFGGLFLIYWYINLVSVDKVLQEIASQSEMVVIFLKEMVQYLMGSPVDLKLNSPLNNVLGNFFLFHIELWWSFLGFLRPLLELGFHSFILLGSLGLSFQIAMLADLLAMASFHVYIIYVYAARLYHAQITGLVTLSRLFLGRKRNPVAGRVDSCPYSTDQLIIGTIAFTVLLFLLPTTLVYYIVFTAVRMAASLAAGKHISLTYTLAFILGFQIVCRFKRTSLSRQFWKTVTHLQSTNIGSVFTVAWDFQYLRTPSQGEDLFMGWPVGDGGLGEIRLLLIAVDGILTRIKFVLGALPLYSTMLWFFNSPITASCVRLTPLSVTSGGDCVLVADLVQGSLWATIKAYRLPVPPPSPTAWNQLFWDLVTGRLIYPV